VPPVAGESFIQAVIIVDRLARGQIVTADFDRVEDEHRVVFILRSSLRNLNQINPGLHLVISRQQFIDITIYLYHLTCY